MTDKFDRLRVKNGKVSCSGCGEKFDYPGGIKILQDFDEESQCPECGAVNTQESVMAHYYCSDNCRIRHARRCNIFDENVTVCLT